MKAEDYLFAYSVISLILFIALAVFIFIKYDLEKLPIFVVLMISFGWGDCYWKIADFGFHCIKALLKAS